MLQGLVHAVLSDRARGRVGAGAYLLQLRLLHVLILLCFLCLAVQRLCGELWRGPGLCTNHASGSAQGADLQLEQSLCGRSAKGTRTTLWTHLLSRLLMVVAGQGQGVYSRRVQGPAGRYAQWRSFAKKGKARKWPDNLGRLVVYSAICGRCDTWTHNTTTFI